MNYRVLGIFISVVFMILSPALSGIVFDNVEVENIDRLDKSDLKPKEVSIYKHSSGMNETLDFEEYICGVVMAEVPADFDEEAIKAMAVAIRSYTLRRITEGQKEVLHFSADVCDDFNHCQAFMSYGEASERWGELRAEECYGKIKKAVKETEGEILYYKGTVADAVYHSNSKGSTESAKNVWGFDIPYLLSVPTFEESQTSVQQYDADEFLTFLEDGQIKCNFDRDPSEWISNYKKSESGRCESIDVCGTVVSGRRMREVFGLRSTCFDIDYNDGVFTFTVSGYGHGVGMSQYGSNAMAKDGYGYQEILAHYYSGTNVGLY